MSLKYGDCHDINPLDFWAMLLDCAKIDSYGREINAAGEVIMTDKLRFVHGREREHRRWPLYDIYNLDAKQIISHKEYEHLQNTDHCPKCDFRPYFNVYFDGEDWHRIYLIEVGAIKDLIFQSINSREVPIIRTLINIHGKDCDGNKPGRLYRYRDTIINATRWAVRLGTYCDAGITGQLLDQIEKGYIGSVEQYQLAWLQTLSDGSMTDTLLRDLGAAELETLRRFVTASSNELVDWFGQQFDRYRTATGDNFPIKINQEIFNRYIQRVRAGISQPSDDYCYGRILHRRGGLEYDDYTDGQIDYFIEVFRPAVIACLKNFFHEYSGTLKESLASSEAQESRKALAAALAAITD